MLEVFKKLTESGWIVQGSEVRQIIQFIGISTAMVEGNRHLRHFLSEWLHALGLKQEIEHFLEGATEPDVQLFPLGGD